MPSPVSLSPTRGHTLKVSLKSTPCGPDTVLTLKEFGSEGPFLTVSSTCTSSTAALSLGLLGCLAWSFPGRRGTKSASKASGLPPTAFLLLLFDLVLKPYSPFVRDEALVSLEVHDLSLVLPSLHMFSLISDFFLSLSRSYFP